MLFPAKDHWAIYLIFEYVHYFISNLEIFSRLLLQIFLMTVSAQKDVLKQLDIPGHRVQSVPTASLYVLCSCLTSNSNPQIYPQRLNQCIYWMYQYHYLLLNESIKTSRFFPKNLEPTELRLPIMALMLSTFKCAQFSHVIAFDWKMLSVFYQLLYALAASSLSVKHIL